LYRAFVVHQEAHDFTRLVGLHFAELLHHFDQADGIADLYRIAFLDEGLGIRSRFAIERSGKGAKNFVLRHVSRSCCYAWHLLLYRASVVLPGIRSTVHHGAACASCSRVATTRTMRANGLVGPV